MDPSEFEGTLQKTDEALHAGVLEEFLQDAHTKDFVCLDLNKEAGDIYLSSYNLQENLAQWTAVKLTSLNERWDDEAVQIATFKEEYVSRRKALAKEVKAFSAAYAGSSNAAQQDSEDPVLKLIDKFKSEFDFVANAYKFSESAFLETYKALRDAPDPCTLIEDNIKSCLRAQEVIKNAQEQLNVAAAKISHLTTENQARSTAMTDGQLEESLRSSFDAERNELMEKKQTELADLRAHFDLELRTREHQVRSALERQQLSMQEQWESSMAAKDAEVASILSSLNEANHRMLEADEREKTLQVEVSKRREIEEKMRLCLIELADERNSHHDLQTQLDSQLTRSQELQFQFDKLARESKSTGELAQTELSLLKQRVIALESELDSRPPLDLTTLSAHLGGSLSIDSDQQSSAATITWAKLEQQIVTSVRQSNSAAVEARVQEQETQRALKLLQGEHATLQTQLQEKVDIVAALERDLLIAQSSAESSAALLKCYHQPSASGGTNVPLGDYASSGNNGMSVGGSSLSSPFVERVKTGRGGRLAHLQADSSGSNLGAALTAAATDEQADLEVGSGGKGTAAAVMKGLESTSDRLIEAVQHQRDRYMKIAKDKESELDSLKVLHRRLQDEQIKLRSENMELYRRLRVLRVNSKSSGPHNGTDDGFEDVDESGGDGFGRIGGRVRQRKDKFDTEAPFPTSSSQISGGNNRQQNDSLDSKYSKLYEDQIDPFRMEELDRQAFISKLSYLERAMAFVMRQFLQDPWARKAFLVYICMIHMFAIGYVFQVLNPQLIDEVDYYAKLKYSSETFDINMNKEHPDVR